MQCILILIIGDIVNNLIYIYNLKNLNARR